MDPVECNQGHLNDPYPDNGLCVVCGKWMPGNKNRFDKQKAGELSAGHITKKKHLKQKAKDLLKDLDFKWKDAPKHLQMIAETAAKTGNTKDMEFLLQQVGQLTAKPRPSEEVEDTVVEIHVSDKLLESLKSLDEQIP
jgi:hypothetical protein